MWTITGIIALYLNILQKPALKSLGLMDNYLQDFQKQLQVEVSHKVVIDYMLNSQADYYKYQGAIDEIAVYYNSLGGNSIYSHYLIFMAGKHYSFQNQRLLHQHTVPCKC